MYTNMYFLFLVDVWIQGRVWSNTNVFSPDLIDFQVRLDTQSKTLQDTLRRLPNAKEMKIRNNGKKSQEILSGDQAQAALDILRVEQTKTTVCRIAIHTDANFQHDCGVYVKSLWYMLVVLVV